MVVGMLLFCVDSGLSFDGCVSLLAGRACLSSRLLIGIVGRVSECFVSRAMLLCWRCRAVDVPLRRANACMILLETYCSLMRIGAQRIMLVLMQLRVQRLGGVPNMSQCNRG